VLEVVRLERGGGRGGLELRTALSIPSSEPFVGAEGSVGVEELGGVLILRGRCKVVVVVKAIAEVAVMRGECWDTYLLARSEILTFCVYALVVVDVVLPALRTVSYSPPLSPSLSLSPHMYN